MPERCSQCVMPSTVPGSGLESSDTCAWCRDGYPHYVPKGEEKLRELLDSCRNAIGGADCLVGLSGGKDSSYAVLSLATHFGLRVEAFTYVHGGLTPLALENAKRVCAELGITHHTVSLKGDEHLESFKSYFKAWVQSPEPVTAAMTCVACKHLHLLGTRLAARRKIPMIVWSNCPLENPPFLALSPTRAGGSYEFKRENIARAVSRRAKEIFKGPHFFAALSRHPRTSLLGCLAVTPSSKYLALRFPNVRQVFFYEHIAWDPQSIVGQLRASVGWKTPSGPDDWHSDCIFNVFKEYMFQYMFGASYTDAFLSNQVRYGLMTREAAWEKLAASKKHYRDGLPSALETVGLSRLRSRLDMSCFDMGE